MIAGTERRYSAWHTIHGRADIMTTPKPAPSFKARAWGAGGPASPLAPLDIRRREPGSRDVHIRILFCGVCHSDLHQVRNEWQAAMPTEYPCVPGHEIVGRVARAGSAVKSFKEGDLVGVGCMVDSCRSCGPCKEGVEQYCEGPATFTYNSPDTHLGGVTLGGYADGIVVDEAFVLRIPDGLDPAGAAPLLCAGITTYSPLRHWKVGPGMKVGVVGLGGLGHMALKLTSALGAHPVLFTTSPGKTDDARRLGAREVVVSKNADDMLKHAATFDFMLDTVSARHDYAPYIEMLKRDATITLLGAPEDPSPLSPFSLIFKRRRMAGSVIGGIRETQEMLDFCARHGMVADIERIRIQQINEAHERMLRSDVKYRFVIDMASMD